jgi:hypothetical protein
MLGRTIAILPSKNNIIICGNALVVIVFEWIRDLLDMLISDYDR